MSTNKCKHCGSTNIETDPARGDAVCTDCGVVLEDQMIVSETVIQESPSGSLMVLGQFVASDSTGGATGFGATFHINGKESREITIQNARTGITHLCQQLRLSQHCIDTSVNFYKLALARHLTRGRKHELNHAACIYITCRVERTGHMLIDISDILQIDVNELGKTYLKFTQALCITIPSMDPSLYIMRFASKLQFGSETNAVTKTAQRVVKRMMKDSIHSGRRPSGLCGAALLIAARLHDFSRTPNDIIKIVKIHESTLRKRLMEFGDTPSSALTIDEFMSVELEEEQDPPAFKVARKKDRERLQKLESINNNEFTELQTEIDKQLDEYRSKKKRRREDQQPKNTEETDTDRFIQESTMDIIENCLKSNQNPDDPEEQPLGPNIESLNLPTSIHDNRPINGNSDSNGMLTETENGEIDLTGIDDDELDSYILPENLAASKTNIWNEINADYLEQQKEKELKRQREKEEGKPEKKKRRTGGRKKHGPASSAGEAIEKMLQEKRISSKINYEVLKSLNVGSIGNSTQRNDEQDVGPEIEPDVPKSLEVKQKKPSKTKKPEEKIEVVSKVEVEEVDEEEEEIPVEIETGEENLEEVEDEEEPEETTEISVLLQRHSQEDDDFGYGYDDEEDY